MARLVVLLASEEAGFSTGSESVVDGGAVTGEVRRVPAPAGRWVRQRLRCHEVCSLPAPTT